MNYVTYIIVKYLWTYVMLCQSDFLTKRCNLKEFFVMKQTQKFGFVWYAALFKEF